MRVALVTHVEEEAVVGEVEAVVEGEGDLHHPEVGGEVATAAGDLRTDHLADLRGERFELVDGETAQVRRRVDPGQEGAGRRRG